MRLFLYLLVLLLVACAAQRPSGTAPPAPQSTTGPASAPASEAANPDLVKKLERADVLAREGQYLQADEILRNVIASDGFHALDEVHRHLALRFGAAVARIVHQAPRGLALIRRACAMPEADRQDWDLRVLIADSAQEPKDEAMALTVLAQRWPQALSWLRDHYALGSAMNALENYGSDTDRNTVLTALFAVYFATEPDSSSDWWRELGLLQLARGEHAAAATTLGRVTDPYALISIEVDKRFDAIRPQLQALPSIEDAARRAIDSAVRHVQRNPDKLQPVIHLASLLGRSLRYQEALQVIESAIDRQEAAGRSAYTDL